VEKHEAEPHRLAKKTTNTIFFIVILTATVYENVWIQQMKPSNRISPERRMSRRLMMLVGREVGGFKFNASNLTNLRRNAGNLLIFEEHAPCDF
jgi:hypothetical protein